jgi:predicted outer membrane lipoprotein
MTRLSAEEFGLLNALWLRKMATRGMLEENAGLTAEVAETCLGAATDGGLVRGLGDYIVLTDEGRRAVLDHYNGEYSDLREQAEFLDWYERFEGYNSRFLSLMSAWQTETDEEQERTYSRLCRVVERHVDALRVAAPWIPRYGHYAARFERSLEHVDSGRSDYVSSPVVDSLHNIWFEFHEDLLAVLGRPRESLED